MFLARRRKGIFTLFLLASFVIFCTWLLQIKFEDLHSENNDNPQHLRHYIDLKEKNLLNNLKLENRVHDRELLLANTVTAETEGVKIKLSNDNQQNIELKSLFKLLHHVNAFIADISFLREISKLSNNDDLTDIKADFEIEYEYFRKLLKSADLQIAFGIHPSALKEILLKKDNLKSHYNLNCQIVESEGTLHTDKVQTNFYLNCTYVRIQLSIFYNRNEFLWIGKDESQASPFKPKWFGDIPRAVNNFNLTLLNTKSLNFILIPANIKKFIFDYNVSKFIECNRTLADHNLRVIGEKYKQNEERNKMLLPVMSHISKTLERLYKHYWLAGGTLLGWYRDCGVIPHTQDVDFAIFANEYENSIKKAFLGNKIVRVWGTLGLVNDSYEFRMYNDLFTFDMFLVYDHNATHNWCGYQVNKVKFRRWLPKLGQLCSGELMKNKFMIPCDPVEYLNKEYGKKERWITPQSSNYTWSNVNHWKSWSDEEWPHVIKYYDKAGVLIKSKVLSYLNKHSKINITEIPPEFD